MVDPSDRRPGLRRSEKARVAPDEGDVLHESVVAVAIARSEEDLDFLGGFALGRRLLAGVVLVDSRGWLLMQERELANPALRSLDSRVRVWQNALEKHADS